MQMNIKGDIQPNGLASRKSIGRNMYQAQDHLKDMFAYLLNAKDCKKCNNPPKSTLLFRNLSKKVHRRNS